MLKEYNTFQFGRHFSFFKEVFLTDIPSVPDAVDRPKLEHFTETFQLGLTRIIFLILIHKMMVLIVLAQLRDEIFVHPV